MRFSSRSDCIQRARDPRRIARLGDNASVSARLGPFGQMPFATYWAGGLLSNIGTWLQAVVGSVFVYDRTGSAFAVGVLNFATFLPILLFSVWGGILSDRFDRRLITVVTHAVSFAIAGGLAVLASAGAVTEVHVIATAFLLQTSWAIAKPSVISLLPALVPRVALNEAVGLNTLQFMLAQLAGPLLATALLGASGYTLAFAINAATFIGPILSMAYLYVRGLGGQVSDGRRSRAEARTGVVGYIHAQPWIASVLIGVIAASAASEVIRTTAPALVSTRLGRPTEDTGLIFAAQSVGMVIGILSSVPLGRRGHARRLAALGLVLQLIGLGIVGLATDLGVAALGVALIGCGFSFCFPVLTGTLQSEVPDALRGRVMSLHQMAHLGNRPFAALAAGAITASLGVPAACLAGMLLAPTGLVAVRAAWRALDRRVDAARAVAAGEGVAGSA
jgi:MFS family permease